MHDPIKWQCFNHYHIEIKVIVLYDVEQIAKILCVIDNLILKKKFFSSRHENITILNITNLLGINAHHWLPTKQERQSCNQH